MYRSYSVNNMPTPINTREQQEKPPAKREGLNSLQKPCHEQKKGGIFDNIQTDDIILFIVVLALIMDDCDDKLLLAALGFIFLTDFL